MYNIQHLLRIFLIIYFFFHIDGVGILKSNSLSNWVCRIGKEVGLFIVMIHSECDGYECKSRIWYECENSEKYRKRKDHYDVEPK